VRNACWNDSTLAMLSCPFLYDLRCSISVCSCTGHFCQKAWRFFIGSPKHAGTRDCSSCLQIVEHGLSPSLQHMFWSHEENCLLVISDDALYMHYIIHCSLSQKRQKRYKTSATATTRVHFRFETNIYHRGITIEWTILKRSETRAAFNRWVYGEDYSPIEAKSIRLDASLDQECYYLEDVDVI
jgi:hypothetical protein